MPFDTRAARINRVGRLNKLIGLDAPLEIIFNEAILVAKACKPSQFELYTDDELIAKIRAGLAELKKEENDRRREGSE